MEQKQIFLIIIGMMLVTYGPRLLPILALSSRPLPPSLTRWLQLIPAAVLAALLAPALFAPQGELHLSSQNYFLWAALPTLLVAIKGKSFVWAILTGMAVVALLRYLG
ncbi:MAG: AzlD domain-containing protein [Thermodesulfobacteriota bacterium]